MQHIAHTAVNDQLPVKALILLLREVVAYGSEPAHLNVRKYTMASAAVKFHVSLCNVMDKSIPQHSLSTSMSRSQLLSACLT